MLIFCYPVIAVWSRSLSHIQYLLGNLPSICQLLFANACKMCFVKLSINLLKVERALWWSRCNYNNQQKFHSTLPSLIFFKCSSVYIFQAFPIYIIAINCKSTQIDFVYLLGNDLCNRLTYFSFTILPLCEVIFRFVFDSASDQSIYCWNECLL